MNSVDKISSAVGLHLITTECTVMPWTLIQSNQSEG